MYNNIIVYTQKRIIRNDCVNKIALSDAELIQFLPMMLEWPGIQNNMFLKLLF